jgi:hypothetical protein
LAVVVAVEWTWAVAEAQVAMSLELSPSRRPQHIRSLLGRVETVPPLLALVATEVFMRSRNLQLTVLTPRLLVEQLLLLAVVVMVVPRTTDTHHLLVILILAVQVEAHQGIQMETPRLVAQALKPHSVTV